MSSGTSADALDLILIEVRGQGLDRQVEVLAGEERAYPAGWRAQLAQALCWDTAQLAAWHARLGRFFAEQAECFLHDHGMAPESLTAVGSHGQTVFHHDGDPKEGSLQIGEAAALAARLGVPVVSDFRTADRVQGGQGAPISPFADWVLHHAVAKRLAILNLGGIANLTLLRGGEAPMAWDSGPANGPSDALVRDADLGGFDRDGGLALQGMVLPELLEELQQDPFFARSLPRSTGLERFGAAFAAQMRQIASGASLPDLLQTAHAVAAWAVAESLSRAAGCRPSELELPIYLCGGGAANPALVAALRAALPAADFHAYGELGGDPNLREALAFALLADAFLLAETATWPSTTGCERPARLGTLFLPA